MTGNLQLASSWGPFSPTYLGISHILDLKEGLMADFPLSVTRHSPDTVVLPDSTFGYVQHVNEGDRKATVQVVPEKVSPDYSSYALRYFFDSNETAIARFQVEASHQLRCDLTFVNESCEPQDYTFSLGIVATDPRKKVRLRSELRPWWIPARDYAAIEAYQKTFALGCRQCLTRAYSWGIEDEVLAQAFGGWPEDRVTYHATLPSPLKKGYLYFRYIKFGTLNPAWELRINGKAIPFHFPQTWAIPGGSWGKNRDAYEEWKLLRVPVGEIAESSIALELRCTEAPENDLARIWLDGMVFSEGLLPGDEGKQELVSTTLSDDAPRDGPAVTIEGTSKEGAAFAIRGDNSPVYQATVAVNGAFISAKNGRGSLLAALKERHGISPAPPERDSMIAPWGLLESEAIPIPPGGKRTVSLTISFRPDGGRLESPPPSIAARSPLKGPFAEVCQALQDLLLFNINYPFSLSGRPSHYVVPSKYFPLPYSWDGGLTAVGFATFVPELAWKQARYFLADDKFDFPHLYSGSPVPTAIYAVWEAYQATLDQQTLSQTYPGAKRMYDFYLGRTPGSVVNLHGDGLLSTYAYNYNLGIDDHPIQRWAEEHGVTSQGLYSLILMAQILRIAGIMRNMATLLGYQQDAARFGEDVFLLSSQIENRMWDEESGLYGWLRRDEDTVVPVALDGCKGDRSGCGFFPLFAGLIRHKERLISGLFDPERFFTPHGVSSVDMTAPSYNPNGYWNGGIWPVMQWYLWRGLLEANEPALARKIADTILQTWQHAWEKDHYLGEHFMIQKQEMNGAPNFGGLSAILLPMNGAYYTPYAVTTRFDVLVTHRVVEKDADILSLTIRAPHLTTDSHHLLVNMGRGHTEYVLFRNGKPYSKAHSDNNGHLAWRLPRPETVDELTIKPS